jgi:predicted ribosome quality control (RQC) complex YloA/Tae2 family protein
MLECQVEPCARGTALALDSITVAAITDELVRALEGGRVQRITRAEDSTYGIEVYVPGRRHWLVLRAQQADPRLHLSRARVGSGEVAPSPLLLLMRKHLMGARVLAVEQDGVERVVTVTFGFASVDDGHGRERPGARLVVEVIPKFGNLILTTPDGVILDCEHRIAPGPDRVRVLLPRQPYVPPPPVDRPSVLEATPDTVLAALTASRAGPAHRALVAAFAGVSPSLAREAVRRADAAGDASAVGLALAFLGLADLWRRRDWEPGVAVVDGRVAALAPYRLTGIGEWKPTTSISEAVEAGADRAARQRPVDIARRSALSALAKRRRVAVAKLESLQLALQSGERAEGLRADGETVLAHVRSIARGQNRLVADGRDIALDPSLGAVANAQILFKRYRKAKAALANVPHLIEETSLLLRYLDSQVALVGVAATADDVRGIARESALTLRRPGGTQPARRKPGATRQLGAPLRVVADDGVEILVGRSAKQNEQITFEVASPDDVWLHARGVAGAHVIVRCGAKAPSPETLSAAAVLAAMHSTSASDSVVAVDWTRRRHVRRIAGYPGLVTYREETVVRVSPGAIEAG